MISNHRVSPWVNIPATVWDGPPTPPLPCGTGPPDPSLAVWDGPGWHQARRGGGSSPRSSRREPRPRAHPLCVWRYPLSFEAVPLPREVWGGGVVSCQGFRGRPRLSGDRGWRGSPGRRIAKYIMRRCESRCSTIGPPKIRNHPISATRLTPPLPTRPLSDPGRFLINSPGGGGCPRPCPLDPAPQRGGSPAAKKAAGWAIPPPQGVRHPFLGMALIRPPHLTHPPSSGPACPRGHPHHGPRPTPGPQVEGRYRHRRSAPQPLCPGGRAGARHLQRRPRAPPPSEGGGSLPGAPYPLRVGCVCVQHSTVGTRLSPPHRPGRVNLCGKKPPKESNDFPLV